MTQFMIFANADDKNTMDVMYTLDRRVRTFGIDNDVVDGADMDRLRHSFSPTLS